ncbi:Peroxisomal membrane protein 4 [Hondaea fermentalgiana]|uniref:Peroxisomal membrane protein 4 n=1 Tax=Hondaea fermentalgiana TaxID=2315210 RepID=A0A2R5FZX2_9STRA|nr:Peroxisomal membrane protein 4 [Hondaea fermentalgiana]|eukprot:GBG23815.1 Peroxisomal membrane protein 4 [Hondaea fermentalgiana]
MVAASAMDEEVKIAVLSVWRAFRNGLFYGTKIRLVHAGVMTLLFRRNSDIKKMLDPVARMTYEHSRNLAMFAGFYKLFLAVSRLVRLRLGDRLETPPGVPTSQLETILAAGLTANLVWARYSSVNSQIVMYLLSRVIFAFCHLLAKREIQPFASISFSQAYPWLATSVWASVLWLYEYHPETLQVSLFSSMDFLYHQTNEWSTAEDFLPSPATAGVFVYLVLRARQIAAGGK